ncbi:M48 family metallopeptidase [Winogradskyella flava]|nr:M48 family metallopeptidase [Winogradskyella flava]
MTTNLYPPSPIEVPKKLTALPASYQTRAFLAILSILLFFVLYGALVVALGYLVHWAITYDIGNVNKVTILGKVGAVAGSVMLFFFTLKFIFKLKNHKRENRIKLTKKDYPELWSFILKICNETGAPKPKAIYADPDVNAYVSYTNMWLSLFLPVKKELTIGLGLVSCLNLSEFKAVMSHEFGHFSQRSMKIGSYIISANTIIHDMIFDRDKWDDLLDQWRASDLRLSFAAWIITPIIWLIRQVLNLFYQFLNIMYSSLSREMEFNADKVAISTSGSDAIISGLWKLDSGFEKWNSTINYAYLASQKKLFTENLYTHNNLSLSRIKDAQSALLNALPKDKRGGKTFFTGSEHSKVNMYASHPPNDMRQDNAKIPFVPCESNENSPWLLFGNQEKLQKEMTQLIYQQYVNKKAEKFCSVEEFENFIASENHGKELLNEFGNSFENRFINIPEIDTLEKELDGVDLRASNYEKLKKDLETLMQPVKNIESLMVKAGEIAQGTTKDNSFAFKGKTYKKKTIEEGYGELVTEREKLFSETFIDWDKAFCKFHLALAKKESKYNHLKNLYLQHQELTMFYKKTVGIKNTIYNELAQLQAQEVTENDVRRFGYRVNDLVFSLNEDLDNFEKMTFVKLPNIDEVNDLKEAIIDGGAFKKQSGNIFENGGFNVLLTDVENAIVHCQRLDQKSLSVILDFHKKLHERLN